ncbi:MAG: hypothetical protein JWR61_809 [Ferruginibacter sp.]|uniref:baeRF3 domain-containing protein n=1 Tax=Ferruginibacter sp. TaxID=1940288 RepID=UPI0026599222|nr:hypothetical protein [Ferruginibacter sp.]MDB5275854.1 hypothetical protein [Ferruginibacter sp.]
MKTVLQSSADNIVADMHYHPLISIQMSFDPKMVLKSKLVEKLNTIECRVEQQLLDKYNGDTAMLMIDKLRTLIAGLNYNTHKKSIAIYLSPVFEKVLYLEIDVQEKVTIDGAFDIRELVHQKKKEPSFLVMLLTNKESRIYRGNNGSLIRIVTTTPKPLPSYNKNATAADLEDVKQSMLDHFLQHAHNALGIILKAYPLPLFILGNEELLNQFKTVSRGGHPVVGYIYEEVADATVQEIQKKITGHIADWKSIQGKYIACRLEKAARDGRFVAGIKNVWKNAIHHKGSLLLVEKSYPYPNQQDTGEEILLHIMEPYHPSSYIKNTVDEIIEKVFENGGDVEFVEDNFLAAYGHIVLMQAD